MRKLGTAIVGRLLAMASARPQERSRGQQGHLPRHAASKAASRKRAGKLAVGVAVAAALAGGTAASGIARGSTTQGTASLTADMMPLPSDGQPFAGSAVAADVTSTAGSGGHAGSAVAVRSHGRPAAVRHPAPASKTPARKAPARKAPASRGAAAKPAAATLSCRTSGMLPANVTTIVSFLVTHGYSHNAAAGIAGNIYQESKGNPESAGMGGGGLIGFTPLPGSYVTGNVAADLRTQLDAILAFNQQWAGYLPALNGAATPAAAAYIYVTDFERAGIPAATTREAAAQDVASACGL